MMTDFKIGDVVRLKTDGPERLPLIVRDTEGEFLHCKSECERRRAVSHSNTFELVHRPDPQADLKRAIREVLLSDEFMEKFAAAWMKTPIRIQEFAIGEPSTEARNDPT